MFEFIIVTKTLALLKSGDTFTFVTLTIPVIFEFDESIEYGAKIDNILKDIIKDVNPKKGEE